MDNNEKSYLDIDELARKIEERIKALESKETKQEEKKEEKKKETKEVIVDKKTNNKLSDLDKIIDEIDKRIKELDEETISEFDVNLLMDKINNKLSSDEENPDEGSSEGIYDLEEITKAINETIKILEEKRRKKKAQKARYCDLARKRAREDKR